MKRALCGLLLVLSCVCASAAQTAIAGAQVRSMRGGFDDVKERLVMALENRGLVINYTAHVGDMLDRTGRDLGRGSRIYDRAEALEFCSAALSRDTMEADPRNIVFCPYAIAIYTLPQSPGIVFLAYRAPVASGSERAIRALRQVEKLLADIVAETMQ